ncbi:hypothetical protein LWF15_19980 [Kineosporia rhizophila]|uniref:hypothetical protein n=1 Tax=Kineosporia rhizophila TaxID=84633 RepID=UPI000A45F08E|nr:hypothetical protein [Kineosporia rhizophila]MCE0537776.1 hypothetical protein [Kineosporia rhizophila]
MITEVSEPEAVTAAQAKGQSESVMRAAAEGTLKSRQWSQSSKSNLGGIAWTEKHEGVFWYSGQYAWIKKYKNKTGWHECDLGQSVGYSISVKKCSQPAGHERGFDLYDRFQVHLILKQIPLKTSQCMLVHPNGDGTLARTADCR